MIDSVEIKDRIAKCERILDSDPQSQIFAALADAYRKKGELQRAYEICALGLKQHPDYASARIVMAKVLLDKGNYEAALVELERGIMAGGRSRAVDLLEAEILIWQGKRHEANTIIRRLTSADPDDENVKSLLALLESEELDSEKQNDDVPSLENLQPEKTREKNLTLSRAVNILKVMPRVLGVLAVGHDGLVLDGRIEGDISRDEFAALSKSVHESIKAAAIKLGLGQGKEILIETLSTKIWIISMGKYILVITARDDVSMGALRLKIQDLFQEVNI